MGTWSHSVSMSPSWSDDDRVRRSSCRGTCVILRIANERRTTRQPGKVDMRSRALRLPATTHLRCVPNEHPCMLEPAPRAILSLTYSPPRMIGAFGRIAGKWWLQQLGVMQQRDHHASMLAAVRLVAPALTGARMRWRDRAGRRFCALLFGGRAIMSKAHLKLLHQGNRLQSR